MNAPYVAHEYQKVILLFSLRWEYDILAWWHKLSFHQFLNSTRLLWATMFVAAVRKAPKAINRIIQITGYVRSRDWWLEVARRQGVRITNYSIHYLRPWFGFLAHVWCLVTLPVAIGGGFHFSLHRQVKRFVKFVARCLSETDFTRMWENLSSALVQSCLFYTCFFL